LNRPRTMSRSTMVWTLAESVFNRFALVIAYEIARNSMACH
jgi:hypothetical protein